jgi:arsenite-transporting ATPase
MTRQLDPNVPGRIVTPLMRLQDPAYTRVILVTLPETTPVSEAAALQDDLRRAGIEPFGWVINKSLTASGTHDPLLRLRLVGERTQIARVQNGLAKRAFIIGWQSKPPIGIGDLRTLS